MSEIWCDEQKVSDWNSYVEPVAGDEVPVTFGSDEYLAKVNRVFNRFDKAGNSTRIIDVHDPRPTQFFVG